MGRNRIVRGELKCARAMRERDGFVAFEPICEEFEDVEMYSDNRSPPPGPEI